MEKYYIENFEKYYFEEKQHLLLDLFLILKKNFKIDSVLYPGSFIHITPSLVWSDVYYVDNYSKLKQFTLKQPYFQNYINKYKKYEAAANPEFCFADYNSLKNSSWINKFDLLISLNAGLISSNCTQFLKTGGYLLTTNGHGDFDQAMKSKAYRLVNAIIWDGLEWHLTSHENISLIKNKRKKNEPHHVSHHYGEVYYLLEKIV